jgi:hypothetical protein
MTEDHWSVHVLLILSLDKDGNVAQCWPLCQKEKGLLLFETEAKAQEHITTLPQSRKKIITARVEIPDAAFEAVTLN